ncbi:Na+/H+ antiporter subunit E [Roseisolibacter sp. H3M3-2]|uniref:Na+/H+ antiporter subunit E n=1 Tax=Roseisolibacter sp. H3M3-2 TaxID=3031323 RepID=UPI0023DAA15A|nr:Na+/H+ antiporter subunit E [Roseisolibacter sp. H3M3-2]MDF1501390.1 Na+/H+ antiporter subunit E [Roseisolibacter sp. H3M3-2]
MSAGRRAGAAFALFGIFLYDLVAASLAVARIVLARRPRHAPAIVAVPVDARTEWGVALFAYLVSTTPGSTCLHVADDRRTLYVHFLDAPDAGARAADVKALYERRILQIEGPEASR